MKAFLLFLVCKSLVSVSLPKPECPSKACTKEWNPVCGSDGKTYGTLCVLQSFQPCRPGLTKAYNGECTVYQTVTPLIQGETTSLKMSLPTPECPSKACTKEWNPVCGSDGKTYGTLCVLQSFQPCRPGLTKAYNGECTVYQTVTPLIQGETTSLKMFLPKPKCPSKSCSREWNPVCGSDGETYGTLCVLQSFQPCRPGLTKAYNGECKVYQTVTPLNEGEITSLKMSLTDTKCRYDQPCTLEYFPVCGSDGKTYGNLCDFRTEQLCNSALTKVCYGQCNKCTQQPVKP